MSHILVNFKVDYHIPGQAAAAACGNLRRVRRPRALPALWASLQRARGRAAHPEVHLNQCQAEDAHAWRRRPGHLICAKAEDRQLVCVARWPRLCPLRRRDERGWAQGRPCTREEGGWGVGEWEECRCEGVVARGGWGVSVCAAVQGHSSGERQGDAIQWPLGCRGER